MSIVTFETQTYELTDYEKGLLPNIVSRLSKKIGKQNAVTSKEVVATYKSAGYKMSSARWRKIIHHIRVNGLVKNLIATSNGYYIATTEKEKKDFITSLNQRINAITEVRNAMLKQF